MLLNALIRKLRVWLKIKLKLMRLEQSAVKKNKTKHRVEKQLGSKR
jgi:hypothetical protein